MELGWRSTVLLVTGVPSLMAAVMLLFGARESVAARAFLALVVAWVLLSTPYIIGFSGAYQAYPWLTFFPFDTQLWIGPLWLLTVRALTRERLAKRWWLWLAPGAVQTVYYTACFLLIGPGWGMSDGAGAAKFAFSEAVHEPFVVPVESAIGLGLIAYAAWESWRSIARYREWVGREHSNAERVDLAWLQRAGAAIVGLALLWLASEVAATLLGGLSYITFFWFYMVIGVVMLWLALQFLARSDRRFPKPFEDIEAATDHDPLLPTSDKPSPSRFDLEVLEAEVREGGWHFDQDLTLGELARRLGTNSSTLSAALNAGDGVNFTIFINGLRIEAVCNQLHASAMANTRAPNLLDLALDCGFGSKATFNRAFKRHTGLSPREWLHRERQSKAA